MTGQLFVEVCGAKQLMKEHGLQAKLDLLSACESENCVGRSQQRIAQSTIQIFDQSIFINKQFLRSRISRLYECCMYM